MEKFRMVVHEIETSDDVDDACSEIRKCGGRVVSVGEINEDAECVILTVECEDRKAFATKAAASDLCL